MDCVVVGQTDDAVVQQLVSSLTRRSRNPAVLSVSEAAKLFTILHSTELSVTPDLPIFLRLPFMPVRRASFSSWFHQNEEVATVLAAAALVRAPVVNRPGRHGYTGLVSSSINLTLLRAGVSSASAELFTKQFPSKEPPMPSACLQDLGTFHADWWPERPEGNGPYRARSVGASDAYELVGVVDKSAWRATPEPLDHLELESTSVALVAKLELRFALVFWRISADLSRAELARIDGNPPGVI